MNRFSLARASLVTLGCVVFLHWITSCRTGAPLQSPTQATSSDTPIASGAAGSPVKFS